MTQGMMHGDFGLKYKVEDEVYDVNDVEYELAIEQRFMDVDTNKLYYKVSSRGAPFMIEAYILERYYRPVVK